MAISRCSTLPIHPAPCPPPLPSPKENLFMMGGYKEGFMMQQ